MEFPTAKESYVLTNHLMGNDSILGVSPADSETLEMFPSSSSIGPYQRWQIQMIEWLDQERPYYWLHVESLGNTKALDVIDDNSHNSSQVWMHSTDNLTGQYWRFDRWDDDPNYWRMSNVFTTPDRHLDVDPRSSKPFIAKGDGAGQHWIFTLANGFHGPAPAVPGPYTPVLAFSEPTEKTLPSNALIGISVGGAVFVVGIAILLAVLCWKRARSRGCMREALEMKAAESRRDGNSPTAPSEEDGKSVVQEKPCGTNEPPVELPAELVESLEHGAGQSQSLGRRSNSGEY